MRNSFCTLTSGPPEDLGEVRALYDESAAWLVSDKQTGQWSKPMRNHGAALIGVDVWTTNAGLHTYYERQRFTRCRGRDPAEIVNYPAQARFERGLKRAGQAHTRLPVEAVGARMLSAVGAFTAGPFQLARA